MDILFPSVKDSDDRTRRGKQKKSADMTVLSSQDKHFSVISAFLSSLPDRQRQLFQPFHL